MGAGCLAKTRLAETLVPSPTGAYNYIALIGRLSLCAAVAGSYVLIAGCASGEPAPESSAKGAGTVPQASAPQPTTTLRPSSGGDAALPLYGSHYRSVPGVPQPEAKHPRRQEWFLTFPEHLRPAGVLELSYDLQDFTGLGRAYRYTSDRSNNLLRLQEPTRKQGLRLGGFSCRPGGPATYAWARFNNNYVLRLTAVEDPCTARRAILEGEWRFLD